MKPNDDSTSSKLEELVAEVHKIETEIQEVQLSEDSMEVCVYVAGYIVRSLLKKTSCASCKTLLTDHDNEEHTDYLKKVSRGGLLVPSLPLSQYVSNIFGTLEMLDPLRNQISVFGLLVNIF